MKCLCDDSKKYYVFSPVGPTSPTMLALRKHEHNSSVIDYTITTCPNIFSHASTLHPHEVVNARLTGSTSLLSSHILTNPYNNEMVRMSDHETMIFYLNQTIIHKLRILACISKVLCADEPILVNTSLVTEEHKSNFSDSFINYQHTTSFVKTYSMNMKQDILYAIKMHLYLMKVNENTKRLKTPRIKSLHK